VSDDETHRKAKMREMDRRRHAQDIFCRSRRGSEEERSVPEYVSDDETHRNIEMQEMDKHEGN
jgi:hypothetical protein